MVHVGYVSIPDSRPIPRAHGLDCRYDGRIIAARLALGDLAAGNHLSILKPLTLEPSNSEGLNYVRQP